MKLVPRLQLLGVALPVLGMLCAVALADILFAQTLEQDLDDRLLAQAAAESVSLFDGFTPQPHFHSPNSMLAKDLATLGTELGLLNSAGDVVLSSREDTEWWNQMGPHPQGRGPFFRTHGQTRIVSLSVPGRDKQNYTLVLAAPIAPLQQTISSFRKTLAVTVGLITLALIAILYWQAKLLVGRVQKLGEYLPKIKQASAPDPVSLTPGDELSELEVALHNTAVSLHQQNEGQEHFLANAAHQLRTPLSVLRTEIDVALRKPRSVEELRDTLEAARRESDRLADLAKRLLDFESLRSHEFETTQVAVRSLAEEAIERTRAQAEGRTIELNTEGTDGVELLCDPTMVIQSLENLIDNALRFSSPQSAVEVRVGLNDGALEMTVNDHGVGISPEDADNIFKPFYCGRNGETQTGLGLAFVADVARRHGGHAFVRSGDKSGTTSIGLSLPQPLVPPQ